jgi:predicted Holliday junction resolvase-like endonuclease
MAWLGEIHVGFELIMALVLLVMLYAITLINRTIRLIQDNVEGIEKDLQLVNEEIKMLSRKGTEADLSDWAKAEGLQEKR